MKPSLDSLEAISIKNRLDLELTVFKRGFIGDIEQRRETISLLAERYKLLTGHEYVYSQQRIENEND